jgi:hypothetical protein
MKTMKTILSVIIIAIFLIAFAGFNYANGTINPNMDRNTMMRNEDMPFRWSPIIGLVLLVGGILVIRPGKDVPI